MFAKLFKSVLVVIGNSVIKIGGILVLFSLVDYILKWKIINTLLNLISPPLERFFSQLQTEVLNSPIITLIIGISFPILLYILVKFWNRLNSIAGEFRDDFKDGLNKWEFGGEGWKIEKEAGDFILSVSESSDGGIT